MPAPLTGFEERGRVEPWTTFAEEADWLDAMQAYTDKITVTTVGQSVQGNPMRLVKIGTGPRPVVWVAQQHGNEPAGRDAAFSMIRQFVDSTDPAVVDYLAKVTLWIMPTCHPDNQTVRNNVNNVNLNRDHLHLTQPETQAIHAVIRDARPEVLLDLHEYFRPGETRFLTATGNETNKNSNPAVLALSKAAEGAMHTALTGGGFVPGYYDLTFDPTTMRGHAASRNMVCVLCEAPAGSGVPAIERHDAYLVALDAAWRWHRANLETVRATVASARAQAAANRESVTLYLESEASGVVVSPVPRSYRLTAAQWDTLAVHRDRFRLTGREESGGYVLPTSQEEQTVLAYLVAPESPQKLVSGVPYGTPTPGLPIPATGYTLRFRHNGVTYPATLKVKA